MKSLEALKWMEWIFIFAQTLFGLEFYQLIGRSWFTSLQSWELIRAEAKAFPRSLLSVLTWFMKSPNRLRFILLLRQVALVAMLLQTLTSSLVFLPAWLPISAFLFLQVLWLLFCRGNFNGGSDFMSFVVGIGILIARLSEDKSDLFAHAALWFVALQSVSSYFVAGWVKLKSKDWLKGKALLGFLNSSNIQPYFLSDVFKQPRLAVSASLGFLMLECLFPIVWMGPIWARVLLPLVLLFHVFNFLFFGLNRFVWIWLATYPAIYYTSIQGLQF